MIDLVIILFFLVINLAIGYVASQHTHRFSEFSVGARNFSSFAIFCTLSATFLGGGYTLGTAASVFDQGMVVAYALLGFSLKECLVAGYIAPRMGAYRHCLSLGDMIADTYGNKAKIATGVFSMLICGGILGAQVGALNTLIKATLPISPLLGTGIGLAVLFIYAAMGGMRAVVYTDVLQFCILFVGIPLTLFMGLHHLGGWGPLTQQIPADAFSLITPKHSMAFFITLFLSFLLGETLVPPYAQRLFMAKSTGTTRTATLMSAVVSVPLFLIAGLIGLVAYAANPTINSNEAFTYLINHYLPAGLRGLVIAAVLSIILSSASSFLNAASIAFTHDIVMPLNKKNKPLPYLRIAQLSTLIVGGIAVLFALCIDNVLTLLLTAYECWSPIMLTPLLFAVFKWRTQPLAFWAGGITGILSTLLCQTVITPSAHWPLLAGIGANIAITLLVNLIKKPD